MKDQRVRAGKVELQLREHEHKGDAVIFLHFGGGNLMMWQGVIPYLHNDYRLILFDLKGHGRSDKPLKGYHIDELAREVVSAMDNLQLERAHIVGSSLGAEVGLSLAANYPDRALSLVCEGALHSEFGPYGLWEGSEEKFKAHAAQTLEKLRNAPEVVYSSVDALVEEKRQLFEEYGWWNEIYESVLRYDAVSLGEEKFTTSWGRIAADYTEDYLFYQFEAYYTRVKCPVLLMPDTYLMQDERKMAIMEDLFKLVDRGRIISIPGWVHPFGWMLTPESASRALLDFFAEFGDQTTSRKRPE